MSNESNGSVVQLDKEVVDSLQELLGENFKLLVETFLGDCTVRLDKMVAALDPIDADTLRREAHGIKGSCRNVGANPFGDVCSDIEAQAGNGQLEDIAQKVTAAQQLFAAVESEFQSYLA